MKYCIWCLKTENDEVTTFIKKAHTFPQSLNGKNICENVCDKCNHYFGSPTPEVTSVETALKEALNLSKYLLLKMANYTSKQKSRYKSDHFSIDWEKNVIKPKPKYLFKPNYQEKLGKQLRRGFYKVYLEERERQRKDALDSRFDFIRQFARYGIGDYPIYNSKPKGGLIFYSQPDTLEPTIRFTETSDKLDEEFRFYQYPILGHYISIPTSVLYEIQLPKYRKHLVDQGLIIHEDLIEIKTFEDLDFTFRFMNNY